MKVIIADDHPVVRQGLRQMLAAEADLSVVGEAKNGQEVVELSRRVPWEVAVLDYNMPGKNGLELIKELLRKVWADQLSFVKLDLATPEKLPVGPGTVIDDNIAFRRGQ